VSERRLIWPPKVAQTEPLDPAFLAGFQPLQPRLSDHALVRFMERAWEIDFEPIRQAILTPVRIDAIASGARRIHLPEERVTLIIDRGVVVTAAPYCRNQLGEP
jgi:hypothetical protein